MIVSSASTTLTLKQCSTQYKGSCISKVHTQTAVFGGGGCGCMYVRSMSHESLTLDEESKEFIKLLLGGLYPDRWRGGEGRGGEERGGEERGGEERGGEERGGEERGGEERGGEERGGEERGGAFLYILTSGICGRGEHL